MSPHTNSLAKTSPSTHHQYQTKYNEEKKKKNHPRLIFFHKLTPYGPETRPVHQPPHIHPYFTSITCLQRASFSSHFPNKASLKSLTFLIPKPPGERGVQTVTHLTKWNLGSSPRPPHKKFCWNFAIQLATKAEIGNKDRKWVGIFDRVLLIKVTLSPLDKYKHFHPANLLFIFSNIGFHIVLSLNLAPKEDPKISLEEYLANSQEHSAITQYYEPLPQESIQTYPNLFLAQKPP